MEARNKMQLDMQNQLEEMMLEFDQLRGMVEKNTFQINQVIERQKNIYREIDEVREKSKKVKASPKPLEVEEIYSTNASENDEYDAAVNLILQSKDYVGAAKAFNTFLKKYPNSAYLPNAHYWLGQLYFSKNKLDLAKKHFGEVSQFVESSKRADAILKLGIIEQKLKNHDAAKSRFNEVIEIFPDSTSAKQAQKMLDKI